jgi:hypothetical protein
MTDICTRNTRRIYNNNIMLYTKCVINMIIIYDFGLVSSFEMTQWSVRLFFFFLSLVIILQIDSVSMKNLRHPTRRHSTPDGRASRTSLEIPVRALFRGFVFDSPELDRPTADCDITMVYAILLLLNTRYFPQRTSSAMKSS